VTKGRIHRHLGLTDRGGRDWRLSDAGDVNRVAVLVDLLERRDAKAVERLQCVSGAGDKPVAVDELPLAGDEQVVGANWPMPSYCSTCLSIASGVGVPPNAEPMSVSAAAATTKAGVARLSARPIVSDSMLEASACRTVVLDRANPDREIAPVC
jgi:hypothetical protein